MVFMIHLYSAVFPREKSSRHEISMEIICAYMPEVLMAESSLLGPVETARKSTVYSPRRYAAGLKTSAPLKPITYTSPF